MDLKGCTLELAQRNSQISVPFAVSNLGYGMLWNNPAVGQVTFGKNYTEWNSHTEDLLTVIAVKFQIQTEFASTDDALPLAVYSF